jgi:hypothetical protein
LEKLSELLLELRSPYYTLDQAVDILNRNFSLSDIERAKHLLRKYRASYSGLEALTKNILKLLDHSNLDFDYFCDLIQYKNTTVKSYNYNFSNKLSEVLLSKIKNEKYPQAFREVLCISEVESPKVVENLWTLIVYMQVALGEPVFLVTSLSMSRILLSHKMIESNLIKAKEIFNLNSLDSAFLHQCDGIDLLYQLREFKEDNSVEFPIILDYKSNQEEFLISRGFNRLIKLYDY